MMMKKELLTPMCRALGAHAGVIRDDRCMICEQWAIDAARNAAGRGERMDPADAAEMRARRDWTGWEDGV